MRRWTFGRFRASAGRRKRIWRTYGIHRVGDLARLDESFLESLLGKWGLALAGKAHGLDAGGYFQGEVGDHDDPKSISHEHTFGEDTPDSELLESTLAKLSQMVGRRLREHEMHARTVQIKLRYSDFTTLTRAHTLEQPTQIDIELIEHSRLLFRKNWNGAPVRLLGVQVSSLEHTEGQLNLLEGEKTRSGAAPCGSRQTSRPLRREERVGRFRSEGHVRRARTRKPRGFAGQGTEARVGLPSLLTNTVEGVLAAKVQASLGHSRCRDEHLVRHAVGREHFVLLAHLHDDDIAFLARQI